MATQYGYVLAQTGERVDASEIERADLDQIEVTVAWGDNVLATAHVPAGTAVCVGEAKGCAATVPADRIGAPSLELVRFEQGAAYLTPPAGAEVRVDGMPRTATDDLEIRRGHRVDVAFGDLVVTLQLVAAAKRPKRAFLASLRDGALQSVGGSALFHVGVVAALALFMPALANDDSEAISRDQILMMQTYLDNAAENERDAQQGSTDEGATASEDTAAGGARAQDAEGAMGRPTNSGAGHWSAAGNARPQDATLARSAEVSQAKTFGVIGLLSSAAFADPDAPVVPWGSELNGSDKESHAGNMWSGDLGDAFGYGLGLTGVGEGGGGRAEGFGVNDVGGLGRDLGRSGNGTCVAGGPCEGGMGHGIGRVGGTHVPHGPTLRYPKSLVTNGRLPAEVIQRIVRQNQGRYRNCYEAGLRTNPALEGRVTVKFIIDRTGAVATANDMSSSGDLPDAQVRACVVKSFYALSFPQPDNGVVQVSYPLVFSPAE